MAVLRKVISRVSKYPHRNTPFLEELECGHQFITMYRSRPSRHCDKCQEQKDQAKRLAKIHPHTLADMSLHEIKEVLQCDL